MSKKKPQRVAIKEGDVANEGMNGNRVWFCMGKTINLGNYEALRVEYGECRVVEDGESFKRARRRVKKVVEKELMDMVKAVEDEVG